MLIIDKEQNITLTRGDTLTLTVGLKKVVPPEPPETEPTVEEYIPDPGDEIRFAVSKEYVGQAGYKLILSKTIPHDTLTFTCSSQETTINYDTYNYDVEITHPDGCVDTFISKKLTITGEVK